MILKLTLIAATMSPLVLQACDEGKRDETPRSPSFHEKVQLSTLVQQALIRTRQVQSAEPAKSDRLEGHIQAMKSFWEAGDFRGVHSKLPRDMQSRTTNCELDYGTFINWERTKP